jgi:hypothetical protein
MNIKLISSKVRSLRTALNHRDSVMADIYAIRNGDIETVFPGMFSEDFPKPVIQNFIDTCAKDTSEQLAVLPAFNCNASTMVSDAARTRADKRTKGARYYIDHSKLQTQMYRGADYYVSYGTMPIRIEADFKAHCPRINLIDPRGTYPEIDRYGKVLSFSKVFKYRICDLVALYPEYASAISGRQEPWSTAQIEVVMYEDGEKSVMFVPDREDLILNTASNDFGECPVVVAQRPGITDTPRGQFDDVMWIQVARNRFAMMAMQAAEQAVEAPLALPYDVQEMAYGPMATLRTNNPKDIRRVGLEISPAAFQEGALLDQEMKNGARYPGVRQGNLDASIITGQGVKALEGGFDSATRSAQDVLAETFKDMMRICFKMDEHYWGNEERSIRGLSDGVPYEIQWKPKKDIAGDHTCDVTYGFAAGMDPNRALVFLLQLRGDKAISRDLLRRQIPFGINVTQEEQRIEVEDLREGLLMSLLGYAQSIPQMAMQGQDPAEVLTRISDIIKGRQKGKPLEDVVSAAFAPVEPPPGSGGAGPLGAPGAGMGAMGGAPMGDPNQMGAPPDLMTMLSSLGGGGEPSTSVSTKRTQPV